MSAVPAASRLRVHATSPFGWPRNQRSPSPEQRRAARADSARAAAGDPQLDDVPEARTKPSTGRASGSSRRISPYIDRQGAAPEPRGPRRGKLHPGKIGRDDGPGDLALATRGLRKSYGSRLALDGLDLSVPTGVVYGFLGPNGAGKTTTMRLLTGLIHPDARRDRAARPAVPARRPAAPVRGRRARRVAVVLPVPLRAAQNLRALAAAGAPVPTGRIEELLELVGLRERAERQGRRATRWA